MKKAPPCTLVWGPKWLIRPCSSAVYCLVYVVVAENLVRRRAGVTLRNYYGSGSGPIWLDNVYCIGDELTIAECGHRGWGVLRSCSHSEDVSIFCDYSE